MSERRFSGVARLYGARGAEAIARAHLCVVGVGGVGSWTVEALARSGAGRLTLIDPDHVAESNVNRQLHALEHTLGRAKVEVLDERIAAIHPGCRVHCVDAAVTAADPGRLIAVDADWVIDCIDDARTKAALIAFCRRRRQRIVTVGAAGGQRDPARVRVSDLRRTEQDALLARTRRILRREAGFPANPRRSFGVPAVWSDEPVRAPGGCVGDGSLNCAGFGSSMPVTATFGLVAAAHVLDAIAREADR